MTDRNPPENFADEPVREGESLEEVAQDGPLPETDAVDAAAEAGEDTSEVEEPGDNRDTDPIAGGGILGNIAQSR